MLLVLLDQTALVLRALPVVSRMPRELGASGVRLDGLARVECAASVLLGQSPQWICVRARTAGWAMLGATAPVPDAFPARSLMQTARPASRAMLGLQAAMVPAAPVPMERR